MAGQLFLRRLSIQEAADELQHAKDNDYPDSWVKARRLELNHQVKMFKHVAEVSLHEHQREFGANFMSDPTPKDLMEMGY
jgi:hypothetical protein